MVPFLRFKWNPDGVNFQQYLEKIEFLCNLSPEILIIARLPLGVPDWWREKYPEELALFENGERFCRHSMASQRWRDDATLTLDTLIAFLKKEPVSKHILGYTLDGEWVA